MKKIHWGIIGCGDVTEVKSGPGFQLAEHSELVAVMRRNGALAKDYAQRHKVPKWYDKAQSLIDDPDVNAVYIATPPESHLEYVKAVVKAGKPVYVEKPMTRSYAEAKEMVAVCRKADVPLFIAHYRRGLPRFIKIKELIIQGEIGTPQFVNIVFHKPATVADLASEDNWRVQPEIAGCGYFCDLAPHMLDIIQFFFGNIHEASGQHANLGKIYSAEDTVSGYFVFKNGAHGTGLWNFNSATDLDRTEIMGTKGKLSFSVFGNDPIEHENNTGIKTFPIENPRHIQQPLIQTIVNQLLSKGTCPSTGETALPTSWVMDRLLGRI